MPRHEKTAADAPTAEVLDRRALLRRAGTVAAVAGGAAIVGGVGTAQASAGGTAILGANDAQGSTTSITSTSSSDATLNLANTGGTHGPLSLVDSPVAYTSLATKTTGELYADSGDLFWVDGINKSGVFVFTETVANQVVGIKPIRMLDTRSSAGRVHVINPTVLNAAGQLLGGKWVNLDFTGLADFFESAFVNLTAVTPSAGGYLSIAPAPPTGNGAPATSSLNYGTATLANAAVVPTIDGTVWIYASRTTHVLLDVTALNLPGSSHLLVAQLPSVRVTSNADRRAAFAKSRAAALTHG